MNKDKIISSSLENYLETIYTLSMSKDSVRVTDIAKVLNISKPSTNRAVNVLKIQGFVEHEPYGSIHLTEKGYIFAEQVYSRHLLVKRFLKKVLSVEEEYAEKEAGLIEHALSEHTIKKLEVFIEQYLA